MVGRILLNWYKKVGRDLPWRRTRNPYRILVSEIMLQQTQVPRVIEKYKEFLTAFPTINKLAEASTADVIRAWKGLGYNRRALFLQKTARAIRDNHKGKFPKTLEELKELPGVGDYTARAVLSFAFEQPVPMMDTNHRRFYQRIFFGLNTKKDKELLVKAEEVISKKHAYDWNQALMDFGSSICTTRKPKCEICPLQKYCKAYPEILSAVPEKKKTAKKTPFRETDRYFRGQIMDQLREHHSITKNSVKKLFPELDDDRYKKILTQLEKDGLISSTKSRIVLPD
jgi:A/G-specific adenine glycosylase